MCISGSFGTVHSLRAFWFVVWTRSFVPRLALLHFFLDLVYIGSTGSMTYITLEPFLGDIHKNNAHLFEKYFFPKFSFPARFFYSNLINISFFFPFFQKTKLIYKLLTNLIFYRKLISSRPKKKLNFLFKTNYIF